MSKRCDCNVQLAIIVLAPRRNAQEHDQLPNRNQAWLEMNVLRFPACIAFFNGLPQQAPTQIGFACGWFFLRTGRALVRLRHSLLRLNGRLPIQGVIAGTGQDSFFSMVEGIPELAAGEVASTDR
jgi:hypothetical protein